MSLLNLLFFLDSVCVHVNELLIRNESESQGGSLTDRVEELLKGAHTVHVYVNNERRCKAKASNKHHPEQLWVPLA